MKVAVIGTGYVGLVTGACLADIGHSVICVDIDAEKIAKLKKGTVPIFEPGLSEVVVRNLRAGRLDFTVDAKKAISASEIVMSAVGTPLGENHAADLKYVKQVARDFGMYINGPKLFVIKSTVPVGTSEEVALEIRRAMKRSTVILSAMGEQNCHPEHSCCKATGSEGSQSENSYQDSSLRSASRRSVQNDIFPFDVVSNPEFLREGSAVKDFMAPDRIIVGINGWGKTASDVSSSTRNFPKGNFKFCCFRRESTVSSSTARTSPREVRLETTIREANTFSPQATAPDRESLTTSPLDARAIMAKLYAPIVRVGSPLIFTDIRSAEIIKYASNAFLATKISFINEIANFCDIVGGDVKEVAKGIGLDHRIGPHFLRAGVGYGGSCLPKDVRTLIELGRRKKRSFRILEAVDIVNTEQRNRLIEKIKKALGGKLKGKKIGALGISFKANTDDLRESPAAEIIAKLMKLGAKVRIFDPVAMESAAKIFPKLKKHFAKNIEDAAKNADALIVLTEHDEFRALNFQKIHARMKGNVIIDGKNICEREAVEGEKMKYICFGR